MKKMTLVLIALFAVAATGLEARYGRSCRSGSCATSKCETSCEKTCEKPCVAIPECFQWRKVAVCPEKHVIPAEVYYTCPDNCPEGPATCTEEEKIHGGATAKY